MYPNEDAVQSGSNFSQLDTLQLNTFWLLVSAYLVFFMHAGFCMVEVGCVRAKNAKNTVIMTLLDATFAACGYYFTGWAFAFGSNAAIIQGQVIVTGNGFIGSRYFFLAKMPHDMWHNWLFQYAFATTATTIVSGAVAERCRFEGYIPYSLYMSMFVYPVVSHWVWCPSGWATAFAQINPATGSYAVQPLLFGSGVYDFAGSGVVHMVGGCASFWAALALGPRIGRFDGEGKVVDMPGHNTSFFILGVFILWFGWYGFNPGSTLAIMGAAPGIVFGDGANVGPRIAGIQAVASRAAVNTTLGASFGLVGAFVFKMVLEFVATRVIVWDVMVAGNGTLAGLAAITGSCAFVEAWAACIIGLVAGMLYVVAAMLVLNVMKVDDPVEAVAIHGFGGMWGVIAAGLFADASMVTETYGWNPKKLAMGEDPQRAYGCFMGGNGILLGCQIVWVLVVIGWVSFFMIPYFFTMKAIGFLRVSAEMEQAGLDVSHHGGSAYNMQEFGSGGTGVGAKPVKVSKDLESEVAVLKGQLEQLTSEVKALSSGSKAADVAI